MTAAVRVASCMAHCSLRAGDLADAKSVLAGRLAVECNGWGMRTLRQRVARIARLRVAVVLAAGDLRRVEDQNWCRPGSITACCDRRRLLHLVKRTAFIVGSGKRYRHQRCPPPRPVLAGVKALAAKGMRDKERFTLKVHPTAGAGACVACRGNVYGASGVVAAEGRQVSSLGVVNVATAVSAAQSAAGRSFPRFSARRRMPRQAVDERK
jgi:hypothetical protein